MVPQLATILGLILAMLLTPAEARSGHTPASTADPVRIAQARNVSVGLMTGGFGSTDAQAAADLAEALDDGSRLRVLPILGIGSMQNIADLINLKGIDVAVVHADALAQSSQRGTIPHETSVRYIAKLFNEEVHVLARKDIGSLNDLAGKPVNIDLPGSGTDLTASALLVALHIAARPVHGSQATALDRLRRGEIAAMFVVGGQPVPLLRNLDAGPGWHFLPVPLTTQLVDTYVPTRLDPRSYADLIPPGTSINTIAVSALLLTLSTPADTARAKRVNHFVDQLFERFDQLRQPGHHPKWQEANLTAQVPACSRYAEAQKLAARLDQGKPDQAPLTSLRPAFDAYLEQLGQAPGGLSGEHREALFRDFLRWRDRQHPP